MRIIVDDAARYLECGLHRGQILREPGHKNTTVRAEDPGKGDHLRWRRERPDSNASIRRLTPCYVSGHKTVDLRLGGTFGRWRYKVVFEGPGDHHGGNFGGRVRGHVGDREERYYFSVRYEVQPFIMPALESNSVDIVEDN